MKPSATQAPSGPAAVDTSFFVTGGTVPTDAPSYIERAADRELLAGLLEGRLCYVLTSRQMGKSSLMARTALKLQERGVQTLTLDFSAIGQNLTPPQWYAGLIARVGQQLRLEDALDDFWDHRREFGACHRFFAALSDVVLPALAARGVAGPPGAPRLVIFVDELDTVRSLPFKSDEFFAAVRELYNRRTADAQLRGITFCLLGVATPSDLIRDHKITPFNVGTRIELHDFTPREAAPLALGLAGPLAASGQPELALLRILHWTGGHPYLTQRLCRAVSAAGFQGRITHADVDRLCVELFLSTEARERDDNLAFVRERILRSDSDRIAALVLYRDILRHPGRRRLDDLDPALAQLRLAGIVRAEAGRMRVRNRIYARVFDLGWVRNSLPEGELRRQRRAFWLGVIRTAGLALPTLAAITVLLLWALAEKRRSQRSVADLKVAGGVLRLEAGDHLAALPFFVEALRLVGDVPPGATLARTRLGGLLAASPQLRFLLPHDGPVEALAYSGDARRLITVTGTGTATIWDTATGTRLAQHQGMQPLRQTRAAADGRFFATLSTAQELVLYELAGADELRVVWRTNRTRDARFVPGTADLVAGVAHQVLRRAAADGSLRTLHTADDPEQYVETLALSADGARLAASFAGRFLLGGALRGATLGVQVLDLAGDGGRFLPADGLGAAQSYADMPARLNYLAFSPDGRWLAACGTGLDAALAWDLAPPEPPRHVLPHPNWVRSATFTPDGRLITACGDGLLYQWMTGQTNSLALPRRHRHDVYRAVLNPVGTLAASVAADGMMLVWDLTPAERVFAPTYHGHFVRDVQFSPDGRQLATASLDHAVRVWTPPDLTPEWTDPDRGRRTPGRIREVRATRDARQLLTLAGDATQHLELWHTRPPGARLLLSATNPVTAFSLHEAGTVVTAALGRQVRQWTAADGQPGGQWLEEREVTALAHAPAASRLALGYADGWVAMRDLARQTNLWASRLITDVGAVRQIAFTADGRWVAFGHARQGALSIHETDTGRILYTNLFGSVGDEVSALQFNPRPAPRQLAIGLRSDAYESLSASLLDFAGSGAATGRFPLGHWDGIRAVAFRDDGARFATASEDGSVVVWDPATGERRFPPVRLGRYHATRVAFSPGAGDRLFATWTHGGRPRLVMAETGEPLLPAFETAAELVFAGFLDADTLLFVDRTAGPGRLALPRENRSLAELQALAVLLHPDNTMTLPDPGLRALRDGIQRGAADRATWEQLRARAALHPADNGAVWR